MPGENVRAAVAHDASDLGDVHVAAWVAGYRGMMPDQYLDSLDPELRADEWRQALRSGPRSGVVRLVAERDGRVVGFLIGGPARDESNPSAAEVYALNVHPDYWGSGAGSDLLAAGTAALESNGFRDAVLWVHSDNVRARHFYEVRGWIDDDVTRQEEVLDIEVPESRYSLTLATD